LRYRIFNNSCFNLDLKKRFVSFFLVIFIVFWGVPGNGFFSKIKYKW
jgi:hypothetical protein